MKLWCVYFEDEDTGEQWWHSYFLNEAHAIHYFKKQASSSGVNIKEIETED